MCPREIRFGAWRCAIIVPNFLREIVKFIAKGIRLLITHAHLLLAILVSGCLEGALIGPADRLLTIALGGIVFH